MNADIPVICVDPGTGIAPARGIVEERIALGAGGNTLCQGCRSATKDQYYKGEFLEFAATASSQTSLSIQSSLSSAQGSTEHTHAKSNGTVQNRPGAKLIYRVACSRDGPPGVKRTYVQDLIRDDGKEVWDAIGQKNGYVYISGSSTKMPARVRAALRDAIVQYRGKTEEEAKEFVTVRE